jgi:hypothetical protein
VSAQPIIATTASVASLLVAAAACGEHAFRLVADVGDSAPGSIGGSFTAFGHPQINASGQVAFVGFTNGLIAESGMWLTKASNPQQLALIIGHDYPVPGAPADVRFADFDPSFHHPLLLDSGDVAFSAPLAGRSFTGLGIFRLVDGAIQRILVEDDAAPGLPNGITALTLSNLIAVSPNGEIAFHAALAGPGVTPANDRALYRSNANGVPSLVLREGAPAPGFANTSFVLGQAHQPMIGDDGRIAFRAELSGANDAPWSRWTGVPGDLDVVVTYGDAAPLGGAFVGSSIDFWTMTLSDGAMTVAEEIATEIGLLRTITRFEGNDAIELARETTPGPIGTYAEIDDSQTSVADDGTTLFLARFTGPGVSAANDTAIVRARPGGVVDILCREGTPAPGYGVNVVFDDFLSFFAWAPPTIANSGVASLVAYVRGPGIINTNNLGAWTIGADGAIDFLVHEGQWLSLDGGPLRQVEAFTVGIGSGTNSGRRPSINDRGDVAMWLQFTNGDQSIVVSQTLPACPGDLNLDGTVDATDLAILLGAWGGVGPIGAGGDIDLDGDTDGADLGTLLGGWGPCGN